MRLDYFNRSLFNESHAVPGHNGRIAIVRNLASFDSISLATISVS